MVSIISQFYLAEYALKHDKNKEHKKIIDLVLSKMPVELKKQFLEDMKQWIVVADKLDSYWNKYVVPDSEAFDKALETCVKQNNMAVLEYKIEDYLEGKGVTSKEVEQGIQDMLNIENTYSKSAESGDLLYSYNINYMGVIHLNIYKDNKEIFNIGLSGINTILYNMEFLETNRICSIKYDFDKSLFDKNENGNAKGASDYYVSNRSFIRGLVYTIDVEEIINNKFTKRKILKWIGEKQFEYEIERKDPNAKYLGKIKKSSDK